MVDRASKSSSSNAAFSVIRDSGITGQQSLNYRAVRNLQPRIRTKSQIMFKLEGNHTLIRKLRRSLNKKRLSDSTCAPTTAFRCATALSVVGLLIGGRPALTPLMFEPQHGLDPQLPLGSYRRPKRFSQPKKWTYTFDDGI